MAYRIAYFNSRFWRDGYVSTLTQPEKLGYIYLITNPEINLCGIYELPKRTMAFDTGFSEEDIDELFTRYSGDQKAYLVDDWVVVINMVRHQNIDNVNIRSGIERELKAVPQRIVKLMIERGIPHPCLIGGSLHFTTPHFTTPHLTGIDDVDMSAALFKRFWDAYPKKVGKQSVERWWNRRKITPEMVEKMCEAIEKYQKTDSWKRGFIPNPLTFLNQGRYEDVIEEKPETKEFKRYSKK